MEELTQCPLCGSERLIKALDVIDHFLTKEPFQLLDCAVCHLRSTSPRPTQQEIGRYYQSSEYHSHGIRSVSLKTTLYQLARTWALRRKFKLLNHHIPSGKILDVGCGTGEFLAYLMSRGYHVEGVEPDQGARALAIEKHSISVLANLEQVPRNEQFNAVTLWHVLEHIPDLRSALKRLHSVLTDGGHLILAIPNPESWDAHYYGTHWAAWDVPRHLSHFNQTVVRNMLQQHGFELISTRPMWLDAFYIALLSEGYRGRNKLAAFIGALVVGSWSNLMHIIQLRPTSSTIYIAKKPTY